MDVGFGFWSGSVAWTSFAVDGVRRGQRSLGDRVLRHWKRRGGGSLEMHDLCGSRMRCVVDGELRSRFSVFLRRGQSLRGCNTGRGCVTESLAAR